MPASGLSASQGESRSGTSGLTERTTPCARSPGSSRTAAALGTRQSAISGAIWTPPAWLSANAAPPVPSCESWTSVCE